MHVEPVLTFSSFLDIKKHLSSSLPSSCSSSPSSPSSREYCLRAIQV